MPPNAVSQPKRAALRSSGGARTRPIAGSPPPRRRPAPRTPCPRRHPRHRPRPLACRGHQVHRARLRSERTLHWRRRKDTGITWPSSTIADTATVAARVPPPSSATPQPARGKGHSPIPALNFGGSPAPGNHPGRQQRRQGRTPLHEARHRGRAARCPPLDGAEEALAKPMLDEAEEGLGAGELAQTPDEQAESCPAAAGPWDRTAMADGPASSSAIKPGEPNSSRL